VVEELGANTMLIGNQLLMSASVPGTVARVRDHGYNVRTVEIDEFEKAEAGLTCMAICLHRRRAGGHRASSIEA
jgi:dimethylargininase